MTIEVARRRGAAGNLPTLAVTLLFAAFPAHAVLGGDVSTIADDQARLRGTKHTATIANVAMRAHEITLADGSTIREFVTPSGLVFAVAWSTRLKPDLASLLGAHAGTYAAAATEVLRQPGIRRHVELRRGDLVVHATAHLNAHVGRAWLQSLVPQGVGVDALR
ncbi:MAG: DUF2844 domain-containing protein [Caldimonas sp.]